MIDDFNVLKSRMSFHAPLSQRQKSYPSISDVSPKPQEDIRPSSMILDILVSTVCNVIKFAKYGTAKNLPGY